MTSSQSDFRGRGFYKNKRSHTQQCKYERFNLTNCLLMTTLDGVTFIQQLGMSSRGNKD